MRKMLLTALLFTMLLTTAFAQVRITGDVRVRPRIDIKKDASGELSNQQLILYWGRLNLDADIGGGYSFHTKLASNWVGHWAGYMGSQEAFPNAAGLGNDRPTITFMELSMSKNAGNWGCLLYTSDAADE